MHTHTHSKVKQVTYFAVKYVLRLIIETPMNEQLTKGSHWIVTTKYLKVCESVNYAKIKLQVKLTRAG